MSTNAFSSLANFRLPTSCRLVENSCCPDKDLLVLFSRLGGTDRMSLWNINQGSKVWEVGVGQEGVNSQAVCIAWSPDGMANTMITTVGDSFTKSYNRPEHSCGRRASKCCPPLLTRRPYNLDSGHSTANLWIGHLSLYWSMVVSRRGEATK